MGIFLTRMKEQHPVIFKDQQFEPKTQHHLRFSVSGLRDKVQHLNLAVFRLTISLARYLHTLDGSLVLMITASHNSVQYNGVKVGLTSKNALFPSSMYSPIQKLINNTQEFYSFVKTPKPKLNKQCVYIGRDCRKTSIQLQTIITEALELEEIPYFLMGEGSTPQMFAISEYHSSEDPQSPIQSFRKTYIKRMCEIFLDCYGQLNQLTKYKQQEVYFDFANGSGGASYDLYRDEIGKLLKIIQLNKDYDRPNEKCGAEQVYHHWDTIDKSEYVGKDMVFFDGDSDRLILKMHDRQNTFDGNDLLVLFVKCVKMLLKEINFPYQLGSVGNLFMNKGTINYLKQQSVPYNSTDMGILNLVSKAQKYQIAIFFQPNGHGGIFFSQKALQFIMKAQPSLQLKILKTINELLRNNSRGYALHDWLIWKIFQQYLLLKEGKVDWNIYKKMVLVEGSFMISQQLFDNEFPSEIECRIQELKNEYGEYEIKLRKSFTERGKMRTNIQGENRGICEQIDKKIRMIFL